METDALKEMKQTDEPLSALATDPLRFVAVCWPDLKLYDKQREILLSVRDNIETFVHAGNELGKDFIAAIVALWFFSSRQPARVITSSSSESQLKSIMWSEIHHRIETSMYPLPFRVTTLNVEKLVHPAEAYCGEKNPRFRTRRISARTTTKGAAPCRLCPRIDPQRQGERVDARATTEGARRNLLVQHNLRQ